MSSPSISIPFCRGKAHGPLRWPGLRSSIKRLLEFCFPFQSGHLDQRGRSLCVEISIRHTRFCPFGRDDRLWMRSSPEALVFFSDAWMICSSLMTRSLGRRCFGCGPSALSALLASSALACAVMPASVATRATRCAGTLGVGTCKKIYNTIIPNGFAALPMRWHLFRYSKNLEKNAQKFVVRHFSLREKSFAFGVSAKSEDLSLRSR